MIAILKYTLVGFAGLYLLVLALVYQFQERLLFFPSPQDFTACPDAKALGFRFVDEKASGLRIRALVREIPNAKGTLVFFHGNASTACSSLEHFPELSKHPLNFVFSVYPGYENDPTPPTQASLLENAEALVNWVRLQSGLGRTPPLVLGESLGSGVATYVASRQECSGLILKAPYSSVADVAQVHYPFLPVRWMSRNPFPSTDWAPQVRCPSLIIHGDHDPTIPIRLSQKLHTALGPKSEFHVVQGGAHNDLLLPGRAEQFWPPIHRFIEARLR